MISKVIKESTNWHRLRNIRVLVQYRLLYGEIKGHRAGAFVHQRHLDWTTASYQNLPDVQ